MQSICFLEYARPKAAGRWPVWPRLVAYRWVQAYAAGRVAVRGAGLLGPASWPSGSGAELLGWSYGPGAPAPLATPAWGSELAQLQAVYEELVATHELPAPKRTHRPPSARKIARDLPGWAPPTTA